MRSEIPNKGKVIAYFQKHVKEKGFGAEGMDWKDQHSQELRFAIINRYIDFNANPSILDVGCGAGAYYAFTGQAGHSFQYTGLDIVPEMIEQVQTAYPDANTFLGNLFEFNTPHNVVIASGTYNARLDSSDTVWQDYVFRSLTKMYNLCTDSVILNFMSPYVDYRYDRLFYPSFDIICQFIIDNFGRDFIIDHDYPLYEFTIAIRRK